MTTINPQIDAAVVQMKARAAEFDEDYEMRGPGCTPEELLRRATRNLESAWAHWEERYADEATWVVPLLDTMNLCALALSLLPKEGFDEPA